MIEILYTGPEEWGDTAYTGDAGIDLPITEEVVLIPGEFYDLPSGIAVAIPEGYYGRIAARSGALRNKRIRVYEGVIDAGYRGELFTYCEAIGPTATAIRPGDRLAQLIIQPVVPVKMEPVSKLPASERGTRGFGSSDRKTTVRLADDATVDLEVGQIPMVYLGGPIDFQQVGPREERIDMIIARMGKVSWYDPKVECAGIPDPDVIWTVNERALERSDLAVFLFNDPPNYGFGSPIEIATAVAKGKRVVVWHNSDQVGVYLRKLWSDGVIVATDWRDFLRVMGEELAKARNG